MSKKPSHATVPLRMQLLEIKTMETKFEISSRREKTFKVSVQ